MSIYEDDEPIEDWSDGDDDESLTGQCPQCGSTVYHDADVCPVCGEFLTTTVSPLTSRPVWFVVLGLLGIVAVVLVLSGAIAWL